MKEKINTLAIFFLYNINAIHAIQIIYKGEKMFKYNDQEQTQTQQQIKKQKSIGSLAKQIDKKEKEIAQLQAKLQKEQNKLKKLKEELKQLL